MSKTVLITGAEGLLGRHARARLHALNCKAVFAGQPQPYKIVSVDRSAFADRTHLAELLSRSDAVLHFAGVNRGTEADVLEGNLTVAEALAAARPAAPTSEPHVVFANSIHSLCDSNYGNAKRISAEILGRSFPRMSNLLLPHVFGEGARPNYNNVTATLIADVLTERPLDINPEGTVELIHAGAAADIFIGQCLEAEPTKLRLSGHPMTVPSLAAQITEMHRQYREFVVPSLPTPMVRDLFNSYRYATFPEAWPRVLKVNTDKRGTLFEAVRAEGTGQCFLSTTRPGVTRGDHFHLRKIERFLVIKGRATIRVRNVLSDKVHEFVVSGDEPKFVDMPTMHTHSIENTGDDELLTAFWSNEFFDPADPDTYADRVLK